jgi:uncharacterized ParB-like nuclease family protein
MVGELRRSETCCLRLRGRSRWYGAGNCARNRPSSRLGRAGTNAGCGQDCLPRRAA